MSVTVHYTLKTLYIKTGGRFGLACSLWTLGIDICQIYQQYSMSFICCRSGLAILGGLFSKCVLDVFLGSCLNMILHKA